MKTVIAFLLIAAPAAAQVGVTGNWSGTYSASIQLASCQNKTFNWNGNASVTLLEVGSSVTGRLDLTNFTLFNSNCTTSSAELTPEVVGTADGSTITLSVPNDSNGWQFTGTASGGPALALQLADVNGLTGTLNLTRTGGDVPAVDVTGSWSGNYNFTDVCPNGTTKKSYSGTIALGLTQTGSGAAGVLTITGVPLYDQNCSTVATLTMGMSAAGSVSGSTFTGVAFEPSGSFDFPFRATIGSGGMSGTASGASVTGTAGTFNLTQSSAQSPASDFSGHFDGTYQESDNGLAFCVNVGIVNFSGNASVNLMQSGNAVSGALLIEDTLTIIPDAFGNCIVVNGGEQVLPFYGTLTNGTVTLTNPLGGGAVQAFSFQLSGDTVSGTMQDSFGDQMAFTTTRSAAPQPSPAPPRRRSVRH